MAKLALLFIAVCCLAQVSWKIFRWIQKINQCFACVDRICRQHFEARHWGHWSHHRVSLQLIPKRLEENFLGREHQRECFESKWFWRNFIFFSPLESQDRFQWFRRQSRRPRQEGLHGLRGWCSESLEEGRCNHWSPCSSSSIVKMQIKWRHSDWDLL